IFSAPNLTKFAPHTIFPLQTQANPLHSHFFRSKSQQIRSTTTFSTPKLSKFTPLTLFSLQISPNSLHSNFFRSKNPPIFKSPTIFLHKLQISPTNSIIPLINSVIYLDAEIGRASCRERGRI